jgi:Na+/H+-dicarboxylate symporter
LFAGVIGYLVHKANLFSIQVDGIDAVQGTVAATNPLTIITGIVPTNILSAFSSNGGVLSVVFVAAVVGIILNQLNDKGSIIMKLCVEINDIIRIFLGFIVEKCAPIGIFALLSRTFATYGISQLKPAAMYILVVVATLLVYLFVGYAAYVAGFAKVNPLVFVKKVSEVMMFGFSTSSSAATLPLNKRVTTQDLGVSDDVASFVLPMGMTINMDGTAIMQVIAAIFVASIGGYELTFAKIIMIGLLAVVASIGTPAAPGAGGIILFTVLSGMGYNNDLALLAYSLILAINRPVEMLVTSLNVTGDAATAVMVAKSEGELDEEIFYSDDDDASFALAE